MKLRELLVQPHLQFHLDGEQRQHDLRSSEEHGPVLAIEVRLDTMKVTAQFGLEQDVLLVPREVGGDDLWSVSMESLEGLLWEFQLWVLRRFNATDENAIGQHWQIAPRPEPEPIDVERLAVGTDLIWANCRSDLVAQLLELYRRFDPCAARRWLADNLSVEAAMVCLRLLDSPGAGTGAWVHARPELLVWLERSREADNWANDLIACLRSYAPESIGFIRTTHPEFRYTYGFRSRED